MQRNACSSRKLDAIAKAAKGMFACHAKALKGATPLDPACIDKLYLKLEAGLAKAESKGECHSYGDFERARRVVEHLPSLATPIARVDRLGCGTNGRIAANGAGVSRTVHVSLLDRCGNPGDSAVEVQDANGTPLTGQSAASDGDGRIEVTLDVPAGGRVVAACGAGGSGEADCCTYTAFDPRVVLVPPTTTSTTITTTTTVTTTTLPACIADFVGMPSAGSAPLAVAFTNLSSPGCAQFTWTFGDSQMSNDVSPGHLYLQPGSYDVTLSAVGPGGADVETKPGYVNVAPF
jgi:hypothetical protein